MLRLPFTHTASGAIASSHCSTDAGSVGIVPKSCNPIYLACRVAANLPSPSLNRDAIAAASAFDMSMRRARSSNVGFILHDVVGGERRRTRIATEQ